MEQKNNRETDNCQTETIQADFENLTGEAVHGFIVSDKETLVLFKDNQLVKKSAENHCG